MTESRLARSSPPPSNVFSNGVGRHWTLASGDGYREVVNWLADTNASDDKYALTLGENT